MFYNATMGIDWILKSGFNGVEIVKKIIFLVLGVMLSLGFPLVLLDGKLMEVMKIYCHLNSLFLIILLMIMGGCKTARWAFRLFKN